MNAKTTQHSTQQYSIKSGTMMQGELIQWFLDKYSDDKNAMKAFQTLIYISRKTFGYRQRYNYIKQDYFRIGQDKLKRDRDTLVDLGILEWHRTAKMTYYRIIEPQQLISTFQFIGKQQEKTIETELTEEERHKEMMNFF